MNQVRYLYEAEMGAKKAKNIKEVKKMLGRRSKSHSNVFKDHVSAPLKYFFSHFTQFDVFTGYIN